MKVLILGSNGLVGSHLLKQLLLNDNVKQIFAPTRRKLQVQHAKLANPIIDFTNIPTDAEFLNVDKCFCAIGTTIKKAGCQEKFIAIDHDLVIKLAKLVKQHGCNYFGYVSSLGASSNSSNFYLKTKGRVEESLMAIGFKKLMILHPSLLLGERDESRPLEFISQMVLSKLSLFFCGPIRKYQPIKASEVAMQLIQKLE